MFALDIFMGLSPSLRNDKKALSMFNIDNLAYYEHVLDCEVFFFGGGARDNKYGVGAEVQNHFIPL